MASHDIVTNIKGENMIVILTEKQNITLGNWFKVTVQESTLFQETEKCKSTWTNDSLHLVRLPSPLVFGVGPLWVMPEVGGIHHGLGLHRVWQPSGVICRICFCSLVCDEANWGSHPLSELARSD